MYSIELFTSSFSKCFSLLEGGAVYILEDPVDFKNNLFCECFSILMKDGYHGNAIYCRNSQANVSDSSFRLCGPDANHKSDGCIYLNHNIMMCSENNGTNNYGIGGAGLFSIFNSVIGTYVKFCQVYKCFDYFYIEFVSSSFSSILCNFIDATNQMYFFWVSDAKATFENCVFIDSTGKEIQGGGQYEFKNCFSNKKLYNMNVDSMQPIIEIVFQVNLCDNKNFSYNCHSEFVFGKSNLLIFLLLIMPI